MNNFDEIIPKYMDKPLDFINLVRVDMDYRIAKVYAKKDGQTYEVKVSYNAGSYDHFNYQFVDRGYYLSITPVSISDPFAGGFTIVSYTAFTGTKVLIEKVKRYSYNRLIVLAQLFLENAQTNDKVGLLLNHVLTKNTVDTPLLDYLKEANDG